MAKIVNINEFSKPMKVIPSSIAPHLQVEMAEAEEKESSELEKDE